MGKNANFYAFGQIVNAVRKQQAELPADVLASQHYLGLNNPSMDNSPFETYVRASPRRNELAISVVSSHYPEARNLSARIGRISLFTTDMGITLRSGSLPKDRLSSRENDFSDSIQSLGMWLADGINADMPEGMTLTPDSDDLKPFRDYVSGVRRFATAEVVSTNNYTGLAINKHEFTPRVD